MCNTCKWNKRYVNKNTQFDINCANETSGVKCITKSQITKEKDDEINKMKEENERLKQNIASVEIESRERKPKIIKKYVRDVAPIKTKPRRK